MKKYLCCLVVCLLVAKAQAQNTSTVLQQLTLEGLNDQQNPDIQLGSDNALIELGKNKPLLMFLD